MTKHFVDMNSDSPTKIVKLIQLSEQFKAGFKVNVKRPVYAANLFFLKIAQERMRHFIWQNKD